jgi:2-dehydropantoate 2-reductase
MRIAIYGAGGAGGYFGARLAQAGEAVHFIARGDNLEALRANGIRVDSILGDFNVPFVDATDDPTEVGTVDVVLLCVKAWQVVNAVKGLRHLVGPDTTVIPIQNGVDVPRFLAEVLGEKHVVGGLAKIVSYKSGPGNITHNGADPYVAIGELDKRISRRCERIQEVFENAGFSVEVAADIEAALWQKFLLVASWGGVGTVADAPVGVVRSVPETRRMLERAMREVMSVAKARKIAVPNNVLTETVRFIDTLPEGGTTSLHRDIIAGNPSELDFWCGAVVRLGREVDVVTPLNNFIYSSLLPRELRARGEVCYAM